MRVFLSLGVLALAIGTSSAFRADERGLRPHERGAVSRFNASAKAPLAGVREKRAGQKYVFMHHIVGLTYHYTPANWAADIQAMEAYGIDAIALNIGGAAWQKAQIRSAYDTAHALGSPVKFFVSFDFSTDLGCALDDVVARTLALSGHPAQFKVGGRPLVSSFLGACLGDAGWGALKARTDAYLMPFLEGLEGQFGAWRSLDTWMCWGCAWPQGNYDKNTGDDQYYIGQTRGAGMGYAATISPWFYTHLSDKNRLLRADNWLLNSRWNQIVAMRDELTFVELATWNDFGESSYLGPIVGEQPAGTTFVDGYPHIAWMEMSKYHITAFRTGTYPTVTEDAIYYWARPHPRDAVATSDSLGRPTGYDWTDDFMWAAAFCSSACTVVLQVGSSAQTFAGLPQGVSLLKVGLAPGRITVKMIKGTTTVINQSPTDYTYVARPSLYNYNVYVGVASATGTSTSTTTTTTTTSTSTSTTSTTSSTTSAPTSTPTPGWTLTHPCAVDTSARVLQGYSVASASNSPSSCQATCAGKGFSIAGVENGDECFCGNALVGGTPPAGAASSCSGACTGNSALKCGGGWRIQIYTNSGASGTTTTTTSSTTSTTSTSTSTTSPTATPTPGWTLTQPCAVDTSARVLQGYNVASSSNSPSSCQATCAGRGFSIAGVENGNECFCGNTLVGGTPPAGAASSCSVACTGNSALKCGGGWRIQIYTNSGTAGSTTTTTSTTPAPTATWALTQPCAVDTSARVLQGYSVASASNSPAFCQAACAGKGFSIAGVENGDECFCGNTLVGGTPPAGAASSCSVACTGNASLKCGGGWRIQIYTRS